MSSWVLQHIKAICITCLVIAIIALAASAITAWQVSSQSGTPFISAFIGKDKWAHIRLYTCGASILMILISLGGLIQSDK